MAPAPIRPAGRYGRLEGLCARGERGEDGGDGGVGVAGVSAEAGRHLSAPAAAQQADRGIAEQGHGSRPLPLVDPAGVLAEGHVLGPARAVFDGAAAVFERHQAVRRAHSGRETGDPVTHRPLGPVPSPPGPFEPEDLGHVGPIEVGREGDGGHRLAALIVAAAAVLVHLGLAAVEQEGDVVVGGAVLLHRREVGAARLADLATPVPLTEPGVPGQHAPWPVHRRHQVGGDRELGFRHVRPVADGLARRDHLVVAAAGAQGVDRAPVGVVPQPAAPRLAVDGSTLAAGIRRGAAVGTKYAVTVAANACPSSC